MERDRVKGVWNKTKDTMEKALGLLTGARKREAKGPIGRAKGKVQNTVGAVKDSSLRPMP
jgi:uncharacterized protein YjbJ (UPF0337 family)